MKKIGLAWLVCLALSGAAYATEYKIGFVDTERIQREAVLAQKAMKRLEKEFAPREQELQKIAKQAKDLQTDLEKESVTLSESDRRGKEQELARLNRDFQRLQREAREDLNLRRNEELVSFLDRLNKVIKNIADTEQYDLIVQEAVFHSNRIDITDKVLKALTDK